MNVLVIGFCEAWGRSVLLSYCQINIFYTISCHTYVTSLNVVKHMNQFPYLDRSSHTWVMWHLYIKLIFQNYGGWMRGKSEGKKRKKNENCHVIFEFSSKLSEDAERFYCTLVFWFRNTLFTFLCGILNRYMCSFSHCYLVEVGFMLLFIAEHCKLWPLTYLLCNCCCQYVLSSYLT